jgi:quercetin dioxygenase-like cupin family protein
VNVGSFESLDADEPYPGILRRSFDSAGATVTEYRFAPAATFPLHKHPQEQITLIAEGEIEITVGERVSRLRAGGWSVVAPDIEHGIIAGSEGARVLAIVVPRRPAADAYSVVE